MPESQPPQSTPGPEGTRFGHRGVGRRGTEPPDLSDLSKHHRTSTGLSRRFVDILAWVITGAWGASFLLDAVIEDYEPPVTVHVLMMAVAGAAFGSTLIQRSDDRKQET